MKKVCTKCGESKILDDFPINPKMKFNRGSWCRKCSTALNKEWQERTGYKSKPLSREKQREYDRKPERRLAARERRLRKNYTLTITEFNELLTSQNKRCAICSSLKAGGKNNQWAVDHDHKTGLVRGILCHKCNRGLGHFDDDVKLLVNAIEYLKLKKEIIAA